LLKSKGKKQGFARLKLEQERKLLEEQKNQIESTINEALLKKQAEIEGRYKQKLLELQNKGVSEEELEKYRQRYEEEKNKAYEQAKKERDQQLAEQSKNLEEKEKTLNEALDKVRIQSESYQADLAIIRKQYEEKSRQDKEVVLKELNRIRENDEKIKSFNNNIYQLISGSMIDFKNQNYDNAIKKLDTVLKYYKDNELFVNSNEDLKNKMETDIFFVDTIAGLISQTKNSPVMTKQYNDIIKKLEKLTNSYKAAEAYYNLKNYDKSSQEYTKVLEQFEEVNKANERLKLIEKVKQNNIAKNLYVRAQTDFNAKNYDAALNNLSSLIKNAPLSDYVTVAINDINKIVALTSSNSKISKDNEAASKIFDQAENFKNAGNYNDALKAYYSVIANYPYSDYTKKSYDQTIVIKDILENQKIESINNKLKDSFKSDFEKYKNAYNNGDLASARRYYFDALKKAFDIYTNNSIGDFKSVEDKYIENLLAAKDKSGVKNENQLSENERKMLADLKKEKSDLEAKYKKLIDEAKNSSLQDKDKKIKEYELQLKSQKDEIENLRKYIEEKEKNISPDDLQKKINDYQDELRIEKEKAEILKRQLYAFYQKENQYKDQQDKINSLESEIVKLKNSYKNLEEKSKSKTISNEDKLKIESELKNVLERKYELEKQKEVEEEKQKIKEYYEREIARLKESSVNVDKNTFNISDLTTTSGLIFGQVKDIVEDSVTFQFVVIDQSIKNLINNGDIVKIVRLSIVNNNKQEIFIGYLQISSLKNDSQYGRGKIVSVVKGNEIQPGDLLKK
jgi:tetratricopeptide (TPR) repeat protein